MLSINLAKGSSNPKAFACQGPMSVRFRILLVYQPRTPRRLNS